MARAERFKARPGFVGTMDQTAIALAAAAVAVAGTLGGCADLKAATNLRPLAVNPSSPVAEEVEAASRTPAPIPSFASIPPKPTDVRPAGAYKTAVTEVVSERRTFNQWIAANPPVIENTEAYAAAQRAKLASQAPVAPARQAEADAFAQKLRDSAKTPPRKPN